MAILRCLCGHIFIDGGAPTEAMHVVRDRNMQAYAYHVWRSYQISDIERGGGLPDRNSKESTEFHESLYASLDLEGELWECDECGRVMFRRPGEEHFRIFRPEAERAVDLNCGAAQNGVGQE